jgi:DNA-binding CsgD family transcriptional regulator
MYGMEDPDRRMIGFIMAVAESQSLEELGATCHRATSNLVDAPVLGLYLIRQHAPNLFYSHNAPRGFLDEYQNELARCDPMIEIILDKRQPIGGSLLRSSKHWNARAMEDLLQRWGFRGNMCGPVIIDSRLAGLIYTADRDQTDTDANRTEKMNYICRSASIALRRILHLHSDDDASAAHDLIAAKTAGLPPRLAEVAALVCGGLTNKEIARAMTISHHTVKEHVANLCWRFGVQNRTELAAAVLRPPKDQVSAIRPGADKYAELHDAIFQPSFREPTLCSDYF